MRYGKWVQMWSMNLQDFYIVPIGLNWGTILEWMYLVTFHVEKASVALASEGTAQESECFFFFFSSDGDSEKWPLLYHHWYGIDMLLLPADAASVIGIQHTPSQHAYRNKLCPHMWFYHRWRSLRTLYHLITAQSLMPFIDLIHISISGALKPKLLTGTL